MTQNLTLEQELKARIFLHQVAITGGALTQEYMQREMQSVIKLPPFQMEEQASQYSHNVMQQALANGTFEELYEKAWDKLKGRIPDNMKVL